MVPELSHRGPESRERKKGRIFIEPCPQLLIADADLDYVGGSISARVFMMSSSPKKPAYVE